MNKIEVFLLSLVLVISLLTRLYKIERPIADWHSWRQADTAAVARNFIKEGFTPLTPKYDDMSTQTNGLDNPNRYRFVEFPIFNAIIAFVWTFTGVNETYARLVTVIFTVGSTALLYFLVKHFSDRKTALLASFFFATIPYNIFYSSTILPGPFMVFATLATYLTFAKWMQKEKSKILMILSVLFANLAILSWPIALFFMLPLVYLAYDKYKIATFKKPDLWIFAILSLAPFIAWRIWISRFPEGIPNWQFLLNENGIRYKGAFFRWLIQERMGRLILTVSGSFLFLLGVVRKPEIKEKLFYFVWLISAALYLIVFASGNVRHDYYQVPIIPVASVFMAIGAKTLIDPPNNFINKYVSRILLIFLISLMFAFGYYELKGYYWVNKPQIVEAGKAVDKLLPKDATVLAPYNGDTAFLYQTNRYGYPITDRSLEKFIEQGTKYLVSVDVGDAGIQNLVRNCKVIDKNQNYVIIEMFKDCIGK
ncbi:MAG: glycosyltransferase family 39 protein [Candidatus Curtissbacteria bacterium]|nr:glycosyltransferase family 39 protein [Candidatus Curtissbacteria bacterium]